MCYAAAFYQTIRYFLLTLKINVVNYSVVKCNVVNYNAVYFGSASILSNYLFIHSLKSRAVKGLFDVTVDHSKESHTI